MAQQDEALNRGSVKSNAPVSRYDGRCARREEIPDAKVRRPEGGHFAKKLVESGIIFCVEVSLGRARFPFPILGFSCAMLTGAMGVDDIREGVRRLGKVYREVAG